MYSFNNGFLFVCVSSVKQRRKRIMTTVDGGGGGGNLMQCINIHTHIK